MNQFPLLIFASVLLLLAGPHADAQLARSAPKVKLVFFAVINGGQLVEPIAFVENGELTASVAGDDEGDLIKEFNNVYYRAGAKYRLIFGGAVAGVVTVKSPPEALECGPNMTQVSIISSGARLKGKVMALATNATTGEARVGVRRMPTQTERKEVERLARIEFRTLNVNAKVLKSHNLTALDVDGDKRPEFVGSFYVADTPKSRALLFILVSRNAKGAYEVLKSNVGITHENQVMSGEIKHLDEGIYNELLLDVFDVNGDGVAEIFTYTQAFEGSNFQVYSRKGGKWDRIFEGYNYHCGY